MSNSDLQRRTPFDPLDRALMVAVILVALVARALPGPRTIDDAYITFRYARNLVEGVGFVYNPGEHVLGTTTPLFATLMAFVGFATGRGDYPSFALIVSALADAATCTLLYRLARRLLDSRIPAVALGLLWAVAPMSVTFAIGGMETSLFILWMTATFWLYMSGRERWIGLTAALGVLTRPDALIWAGLIFLHQLWGRFRTRGGRPLHDWLPWREWVIFVAVLLPWAIFALAYFGSPLPRTAGAKTLAYTLNPGASLVRLLQHFATPFFEYDALGAPGIGIGLALYPLLFAVGALRMVRGTPGGGRALPMLLYPVLYAIPFAVTNILIFRWYLAPPLPAYFLGIVAGGWTVASALRRAAPGRLTAGSPGAERRVTLPAIAAFTALAIVWLAFSLNAWTLHPDHGPDRPSPEMAFIAQELLYEQVGRKLADEYGVKTSTLVATNDIGAIGYYSRATIMDTVGLVTPLASAYYPVNPAIIVPGNNYAIPTGLILETQPEIITFLESAGRLGLLQDPAFQEAYRLTETLDSTLYQSRGMLIFTREPSAAPGSPATDAGP